MTDAKTSDSLDLSSKRATERVDRMLDEAIEDSFPTSDPVSLAMPHERTEDRSGSAFTMASFLPLLVIGGVIAALLLRRSAR